ncbi:MAG: ABC transporter substrate-binding protein [Sulfuricella sp.]|nr:ABC transporter substrate-binding protein [Sulfuricella sp.]
MACVPLSAPAKDFRVVAISSHNEAPYRQALDGFRQFLAEKGVPIVLESFSLETDGAAAEQGIQKAAGKSDTLFLALGTAATQAVIRQNSTNPTVACLVLNADNLPPAGNIAGVTLDFPLETQVAWIRKFLPEAKTIGVLYNPAEGRSRIEQADRLLRKAGMTLYAREVAKPQDLPEALEKIARKQVDALWSLPDPMIYSPQTAKPVLLFSFRNRIPLIGLSDAWVKAGALYALEWNFQDIGRRCAAAAVKLIQGSRALPPALPNRIQYSVNTRTARHMNLEIPAELEKQARQVHE